MKISTFIIALLVVGLIATTFTLSIANLTEKYGVSYDEATLDMFNDTQELNELAEDLRNKTLNQNVESGILDIVGSYIGRALDALKLSIDSLDVFDRMSVKAAGSLGLPTYILPTIVAIMLISVIFIVVSAMIKKDV